MGTGHRLARDRSRFGEMERIGTVLGTGPTSFELCLLYCYFVTQIVSLCLFEAYKVVFHTIYYVSTKLHYIYYWIKPTNSLSPAVSFFHLITPGTFLFHTISFEKTASNVGLDLIIQYLNPSAGLLTDKLKRTASSEIIVGLSR